MKAAVLFEKGAMPQYTTFDEPVLSGDNEVLVTMKAVAIKHLDKAKASGKHYSSGQDKGNARVIGGDGVGLLEDGSRVFSLGIGGTMAEKAIFDRNQLIQVPDGLEDAVAAALPNAVAGSAMALRFKAKMKAGDTVLINGATGFTGKLAVQLARYYGAKKIIATGRNADVLQSLLQSGVDEVVSLQQTEEQLTAAFKAIHANNPIDVVIDYLWGMSASCILAALKGTGSFTHPTRYVSVGAMSGDKIMVSAEMLRSVDLQLSGSGIGSWTKGEMRVLFSEIIPEMFALAARNQLNVDIEKVPLCDIASLWEKEVENGKRLVMVM